MEPNRNARIHKLLQQSEHHDNDERFMATSDLTTELSSIEGYINTPLQIPIRNAILRQLDDKSIDVQTVAVKCLSTLVQKFNSNQVIEMVDKLGWLVVDQKQKKESRDIYTIGLKTIISSVREEDGTLISTTLMKSMLNGLVSGRSQDLTLSCLEIVKELLGRFGDKVSSNEKLCDALFPMLEAGSESIRKRASITLGALVMHLSETDFNNLMKSVIAHIEKSQGNILYTYIQTVGVISVHAGARVGAFLPQVVPKLFEFCHLDEADNLEADERKTDLWEHCFQAFESVVIRCPSEVNPYLDQIVQLCLQFMRYDPNFSYDVELEQDGGDDAWGDEEDEDELYMEEDDHEDDDSSWKVRRAAVKTINAVVEYRHDLKPEQVEKLTRALVVRFKERDMNVKGVILSTMCHLLQKCGAAAFPSSQTEAFPVVATQVPDIVDACVTQMQDNSTSDTLRGVLEVLQSLVGMAQGSLSAHLPVLLPPVLDSMKLKDASLKSDGLRLIRSFINLAEGQSLSGFGDAMVEVATVCSQEGYTRIKTEALRVCESLSDASAHTDTFKTAAFGQRLYDTVHSILVQTDMDQEVKEASLSAMAAIISHYGNPEFNACLPVFVQRLDNEVTRMAALRAITKIAKSSGDGALSPIIEPATKCLIRFLRQQSQPLKHETVICLQALVKSSGKSIPADLIQEILSEVATHIGEKDLILSHLVLQLVTSVATLHLSPIVEHTIRDRILPQALSFLQSPLLQGTALQSMVALFESLLSPAQTTLTYDMLVQSLEACIKVDNSYTDAKNIYEAVAKCIAATSRCVPDQQLDAKVKDILESINTASTDDHIRQLHLLVLGQIGLCKDLTSHSNVVDNVYAAFESKSDAVQSAASIALGNLSVGNLSTYVPTLLSLIKTQSNHLYHLLTSLSEVVGHHIKSRAKLEQFVEHAPDIADTLYGFPGTTDESARSMVAECLGRLSVVCPQLVLERMEQLAKSDDSHVREVVVVALRHCLSSLMDLEVFRGHLPLLVRMLEDSDLHTRRSATNTMSSVINFDNTLFSDDTIQHILSALYKGTKPDPSLIRTVDYGPFKQEEDDGLPLRKSVFQCLDTVLTSMPHRVDMKVCIQHVKQGLVDHDDIQIFTYQIFYNIAVNHGASLLPALDDLPPIVKQGVMAKLKEARGDKPDRAVVVLKSAVRALHAMSIIPGCKQREKFSLFYQRVLKTALLAKLLQELKAENASK